MSKMFLKLDGIRYCCTNSKEDFQPCLHTDDFNSKILKCPECGNEVDLTIIFWLLKQITVQTKRLSALFDDISVYAKVEFENDFKQYNSTKEYFDDALSDFTKIAPPPRFDIAAMMFKKDGYRFMIHQDGLLPNLYDLAAAPHVAISFSEAAIYQPSDFIFSEESSINVQLYQFVALTALLSAYNKEYAKIISSRRVFFYPINMG
jgi:hypothetical protein